jgi:hypothetical protein
MALTNNQKEGRASRRTKRHQARESRRLRSRRSSRPDRRSRKPSRQEQLPQLGIRLDNTRFARCHIIQSICSPKFCFATHHSFLYLHLFKTQCPAHTSFATVSSPCSPSCQHPANSITDTENMLTRPPLMLRCRRHTICNKFTLTIVQVAHPTVQSAHPTAVTAFRFAHEPTLLNDLAILRLQWRTSRLYRTAQRSLSPSASRASTPESRMLGVDLGVDGEGGRKSRSAGVFKVFLDDEGVLSFPLLSLTHLQSGEVWERGSRSFGAGFSTLHNLRNGWSAG